MSSDNLLLSLKDNLIVSCQAQEDEPLHSDFIMSRMALAAKIGGAVAIRANSVKDIKAIKQVVDLPIIGLIKIEYENSDIYITPTMKEIKELVEVGCEIVALDATKRPQTDNVSLKDKVKYLHDNNVLAMGDISTLEEGIKAEEAGFDMVSTTLSGYTPYSRQNEGPDHLLIKELKENISIPVIAEGKISGEADLLKVLDENPYAVVIGGAITRPQQITKRYNEIIQKEREKNDK